ncbi:hypothetical protein niasHT_004273 [Heterodera trifolii]|uniref:MMS19 nucleotide excision repair protein n=1 Tax=Heterodera trifolii TaxID=157864 RepID=A0ABD2LPF6_9BILA
MDLAKSLLTECQAENVQRIVAALHDGQQTLLGHVESERARLTSRDAEERSAALNEFCAVVLQMLPTAAGGKQNAEGHTKIVTWENSPITWPQIDQLLPFLLSKVEDCGHLSNILITTLHQLIKLYDGTEHVLPNECLEQTIAALFDGGGSVQSYGQRDRLLLFSCLDHLVASHAALLRSVIGAQRVLLAFIHAAQGEREPRALARMFALHQRMSANFAMGVLSEDMFELVACYFPIDYEPSDQEQAEPMPITREQLRHSCECALLGHAAFAPYCMQLIAEKLLETEGGVDGAAGDDGCALIRRQLEICEFFIRSCTKFRDVSNSALHEHVDDLMTAVRLLFLNPSVQQREGTLLKDITATVDQMLHVLASMLEHNAAKLEDPFRFIRLMAETTLENVEPFILQAEMGTSGRAFCLLRCLARAHHVTRALCVPRALYWLNTLIRGQTLRSEENRAEITTEALALVPEWLRLCFVADDGFGVFTAVVRCDACGIGDSGENKISDRPTDRRRLSAACTRCASFSAAALSASTRTELISGTVVPLFNAVRQLNTVCEPDVLLAAECEAHSILLLSFDSVPSPTASSPHGTVCSLLINEEPQIAQLRTLCRAMANRVLPLLTPTETFDDSDDFDVQIRAVVQQTDSAKWGRLGTALKQFVALSAHLTTLGDQTDADGKHCLMLPDPEKWPRLLELLPALLRPLPEEMEARKILRKPLGNDQKFSAAIGFVLLNTLSIASTGAVELECAAFVGVREMAKRLALAPSDEEDGTAAAEQRQCFAFFAEQQLISWASDWIEQQKDDDCDQMEDGFRRADRIALLLQDVGTLAMASAGHNANNSGVHARMCAEALSIIGKQQNYLVKNRGGNCAALLRALRCFWLLLLSSASQDKNVPQLKQFATVLLDTLRIVVVGTATAFDTVASPDEQQQQKHQQQLAMAADQQKHWLINALLSVHFALLNRSKSDAETTATDGDGITVVDNEHLANRLEQIVVTNATVPSSISVPLLRLRLRAVETRNALVAEPNSAIVAERLKQFFEHFMALSDVDSAELGAQQAMADLLDLHRPSTCPERCNYRRTLFWRQRLFCQFVPIFVQFARSADCSATKRRALLQLLGPLLQVADPQHIAIDTVLNEFGQLCPLIVDALVDALAPLGIGTAASAEQPRATGVSTSSSPAAADKPISSESQQQLLPLLLDVLRTLLQRMPPARGADGFVALMPRLVHALTANIARQTLLVQSKALECLCLLALPRLAVPPEALLPLRVCVVRAGAVLAASSKRLIRQRMARARNAWELALA